MLKLLTKTRKTKKREYIIEDPASVEVTTKELPPISLFISAEQLASLHEEDRHRQEEALMYLRSTQTTVKDSGIYSRSVECFEKSFSKLGSAEQECPHCRRSYVSAPAEVKKCLGCSKAFFKTKRPQDGATVLVREENRNLIAMQWENIKKPDMIHDLNSDELEEMSVRLKVETKEDESVYDKHFLVLERYIDKSLRLGKFRLYSSLVYYQAEYYRFKREFAKALMHYFYLYFLQLNGASNSVVFGDKVGVNQRTTDAIAALLTMSKTLTTNSKELFVYAIEHLAAFELENLPYGIDESYAHLVKSFEKAEGRELLNIPEQKPKMKSFRLERLV